MKYIYEFIGTFFLVFTIGMTVLSPMNAGDFAPLVIGTILSVMIYAGGYVSGGHYNPAVSLAVFRRGKMDSAEMYKYWIAQLSAGAIASCIVLFFKGGAMESSMYIDPINALVAEFIFTFALCFVVLNVATSKGTKGNQFYGFAIGFTVMTGAYAVGAISGGAFNPAVALGFAIMNICVWQNLWIYLVANLLGGFAAAFVYKLAYNDD